jgi:LmbE family N-acetylglucosaminyl deacetylase
VVTAIEGRGTDESTWLGWPAMAEWPRLDLSGCRRAVVVAPHPDDEILGVGGILAVLTAAEVPVVVVAVTDGEGSHPASTLVDREALAEQRTGESVRALADLGLDAGSRLRLRQPDGQIAETDLAQTLTDLLRAGDWCFATWQGDGHPDHEAVGRAADVACRQVGADLFEFPVWTWHWAQPGDDRVPWDRAAVAALDEATVTRKRLALGRFASQTASVGDGPGDAAILPPHVLARFERGFETVLR